MHESIPQFLLLEKTGLPFFELDGARSPRHNLAKAAWKLNVER
jgi:hypothetical protein